MSDQFGWYLPDGGTLARSYGRPHLLGYRTSGGGVSAEAVAKPGMRVFLGTPRELRSAREFVAEVVGGCPVADEVILLASEVAANAVLHTASGKDGTFTVVVHPFNEMVRIEVHDGGSETPPYIRSADDQAVSGRGLGLVELLAARWGHLGDRDGRVVWFEVDLPPTAPSSPEKTETT
jgi:anti-sigma regulatory factor (Ser/Thr protein kinase)